ncbi:MAG: mercuric transporter MerT family protein [Thermoanaerobaculia bacterium]|nr:mercuric transporter MerT family protein [Thermoanaerobaculia bacterium]
MNVRLSRLLRGAGLFAALGSAVAASLCCTGPLAAGLFGLGAVGSFGAFHQYRPYLAVSTVALLVLSIRSTYARPRASCCGTGTDSRRQPPDLPERRRRRLLWGAVALTIAVLTLPAWL